MDAGLVDEGTEQRAVGTAMHGHRGLGQCGDGQRIGQGAVEPDIAAGDGDEAEMQLRRGQSEPESDGVIGAGITVDYQQARDRRAGVRASVETPAAGRP